MAHILIADDMPAAREALARALREHGHRVTTVGDGQEAIERFARDRPDVVVLDVMMPRVGGLDACVRIKSLPGPFTPVVFVSAHDDLETRLSALAVGEDFLYKPYDTAELCARVDVQLRTRRMLDELRAGAPVSAVPPAAISAPAMPTLGALHATQGPVLADRATLADRLVEEWKRSSRNTEPLALLIAGVDGPLAEISLQAVAATVSRSLRSIDLMARTDERHVAVLLLHTHVTGVMSAVTRLRSDLRRMSVDGRAVTVTVGASFHPSREVTEPADLLRLAERAVARAREDGPGRTCFWQHTGYLFDAGEGA